MTQDREAWFSVDIEASGATPARHSMLSLGACLVDDPNVQLYVELRPQRDDEVPDPGAMAVNKLDFGRLQRDGYSPEIAMKLFETWVRDAAGDRRPVFVSFGTFDWMWVGYYLDAYGSGYKKLFGPNSLDLKSYYAGWLDTSWRDTAKGRMPATHLAGSKHTHHALYDAVEQANMFRRWRDARDPA